MASPEQPPTNPGESTAASSSPRVDSGLAQVPSYQFEELAQGSTPVIHIVCAGTEYCLRRTKAGKLVLNK